MTDEQVRDRTAGADDPTNPSRGMLRRVRRELMAMPEEDREARARRYGYGTSYGRPGRGRHGAMRVSVQWFNGRLRFLG